MENKKRKILNVQTFRALVQIVSFIFLAGLFTVTFGSIKSIYLAVLDQTFTVQGYLSQILLITATVLLTMTTGRFFCGWMCSFGALMDLLHFLSTKLMKKRIVISEKMDKVLKVLKYIFLAFSVVVIWTMGNTLFAQSNPWNVFGMLSSFSNLSALPTFIVGMKIGAVLLALIMIGGFFIERFFCRYLCPLGAIFAVFSKTRMIKLRKQEHDCGRCMGCTKACSMGINLNQVDQVKSGECINCLKCMDGCHRSNMNFAVGKISANKVAAVLVAMVVIMGTASAYQASSYIDYQAASQISSSITQNNTAFAAQSLEPKTDNTTSSNSSQGTDSEQSGEQATNNSGQSSEQTANGYGQTVDSSTELSTSGATTTQSGSSSSSGASSSSGSSSSTSGSSSSQQSGTLTDGVYQGSGSGFKGTTTVQVTVQNGVITNVQTVSTGDDMPYYNRAFSSVAQQIISTQNASVDAVSGATFSSNGIMEAVANAIGQDFQNTNSKVRRGH